MLEIRFLKIFYFILFLYHVMIVSKKYFFLTTVFFHCRLFRRRLTFRAGDLFLKRAYIRKTNSPFSGGVMDTYFEILFSEV
jgi:hypothetical protein